MMMLPPVGPGERAERRRRARRASDRGADTAAAGSASEAGIEAPFPIEPDPIIDTRQSRRGGRRASDRAQGAEAEAPRFPQAPKPYAPLVAQLIAGVMGLEQTRARRRASLAEAEAAYRPKRERPKRSRGEV
ncbi:hypothetical protein [Chenggangzhangella methanolivorans]|uniref:Uncharacterized protein n=1 Tax=Chenggangzhangella methanolivorans TaxID=1437009 RepID=A0A9E6R5N3_9HYPH|nr:hypothetical protein [Chenggangzhangella methanolivorans]QZN98660.1 hypothetical protein K6K41_16790 [Chenggangzhangella methanolivorans]